MENYCDILYNKSSAELKALRDEAKNRQDRIDQVMEENERFFYSLNYVLAENNRRIGKPPVDRKTHIVVGFQIYSSDDLHHAVIPVRLDVANDDPQAAKSLILSEVSRYVERAFKVKQHNADMRAMGVEVTNLHS